MSRSLTKGKWKMPPVLLAARRIMISGLEKYWQKKPLEEFAFFLNGTSYDVDQISEEGELIVRISNITNPNSPYIRTPEPLDEKFRIIAGDLLVSWSASFKSIIWPGETGFLNQHIFKVTEYAGNHRGFIRHAIEATFEELQSKTVGIGMMHIRRGDFLGHKIPAPNFEIQKMVSDFLDWIEDGCRATEPPLPTELQEEHRVVMRVESLTTRMAKINSLREEVENESEILLRSILADNSEGKPIPTPLRELVSLREPDVIVTPDEFYHFAGVFSFGRGVFRGINKKGNQFAYRKLTRLRTNDFTYPKLMAWEGAYGIVPPECDGLVVSIEFPVFELNQEKILPETMAVYFRNPGIWETLSGQSTGTNVRRRRLNPQTFLNYQFPLPPMKRQLLLRDVQAKVNALQELQSASGEELSALMPSVLDRAFKGEL